MAPATGADELTPPGGRSHGEKRFQRAISHPLRRLNDDQMRCEPIVPFTTAFCGPP